MRLWDALPRASGIAERLADDDGMYNALGLDDRERKNRLFAQRKRLERIRAYLTGEADK